MANPLFSVVIPHWNGKQFLETCLDALRNQSYERLEVIIVDNNSHDGSQQYIKDPSLTIKDLITETIARVGENIRVRRFARFELGN